MDQALVEFRGSRSAVAPATWAQRQIWRLIHEKAPDPAFYNLMYRVGLPGDSTLPAVLTALADVVGEHESLRTLFEQDSTGALVQHVRRSGTFGVRIAPVEPGQDPGSMFRVWEAEMLRTGFRFASDLPMRALVLLDEDGPVQAAVCVPHVAADLMALRVLVGELVARLTGKAVSGGTRQPVEHAAFERSPRGQRVLGRSLAYWRRQLADAPLPALSARRSEKRCALTMDSPAAALALSTLAAEYGINSGAVLLAAVARVLGRRAGLPQVAARLLVANRFAPDLRNAVANLHQEVPATVNVRPPAFAEVARSALQSSMAAYTRGHYDPDRVTELMGGQDSAEVFPICFNDVREFRGVPAPPTTSPPVSPADTVIAPYELQEVEPFLLAVLGDRSGWLRLLLSADTAVMGPHDAHGCLREIEETLVREASAVRTLR